MNDENPFHPPAEAQVAAAEATPKRSKLVIAGMYVWIVVTFFINGPLAGALLELIGVPAKDMIILFGRETLAVYVIIASLALFRCTFKTYALTSAIVIAATFVRSYIDCVVDGTLDWLLNIWINFSVVALTTAYLYVAESLLIRRMRAPAHT